MQDSGVIAPREGEGVSGDRLLAVVPALCAIAHWSGDHNHRIALWRESRRPASVKQTPRRMGPGVRRDDGSYTQSTETPANSTTLRHFSVSTSMSFPNSAGVIGFGMPPITERRSTTFGSFNASPTALLRISTTSGGVPLGAEMP